MNFKRFIVLPTISLLLAAATGVQAQSAWIEFNKAVERDDARSVSQMLAKGLDPNTVDERGDHALVVAARAGALPVVKALVEGRAKINLRTRFGDSALMVAALGGHMPVVKFLRDSGAEINQSGWTAVLYAAINGHSEIIRFLLEQGGDPTSAAPNGVTALMLAAREGHIDAVKMLLDYGADLKAKNEKGEDALAWAKNAERDAMVKFLEKLPASDKP